MNQTSTDLPLGQELPDRPHLPRRRAWQAGFLLLTLIPTASALAALAIGVGRFIDSSALERTGMDRTALDSTYRYFGGVYLGVALLALWCLPRIEERANALVVATGAIFLGGVGRLISIAAVGAPHRATWVALVIELGAVVLALAMRRSIRTAPVSAD